jgi:hypothetical protein
MKRFISSIAIGAMILGGVAAMGAATASAAGPSITITPNTALTNGEAVSIVGAGYAAGDTLFALECLATATNVTGCDTGTAVPVTEAADGTFTQPFDVKTETTIGSSSCGTTATDLSNCIIEVATMSQSDVAGAPITFAAPVAGTTTTTTVPVNHGPRKLHVAPTTGLKNGSKVKVSGTGFKVGDHVFVVECLATSTSEAGCDLKTLKAVTITGSGVLHAFSFKVLTGKIGNGSCGTKKSNLKSCSISVANASKGDSARVRIAFK